MERSANSWWLAATAVGDLETLSLTVDAIRAGGLSSSQICLIALEDTMSLISASVKALDHQRAGVRDLVGPLFDWPLASGNQRIVATSRSLSRAFLHASGITGGPLNKWSAGTSPASDLMKHVEAGQIGLLVRCVDDRQLGDVTRHLLANSSNKVTTHAFSYAPD